MNENLIKKCQKGDKQAFNELVKLYYPFVLGFLLKLIHNKETTEDLVQETFIKVIKNIDKFDFTKKVTFNTYLITIAKNTYIDYIRSNNKELQEIDIDNVSDKISSEDKYLKAENYNLLLEQIENLPLIQKEAIKLKYLEGYTIEEIAKIQKTTKKTIKSRLFEGRKKLKEKLKGIDIYE